MKKFAMLLAVVSILALSSMTVLADPICVPDEAEITVEVMDAM